MKRRFEGKIFEFSKKAFRSITGHGRIREPGRKKE